MNSVFDFIAFDEKSIATSNELKEKFIGLYSFIEENLAPGRERALAFTELENCAMWANKAIKIDQLKRE